MPSVRIAPLAEVPAQQGAVADLLRITWPDYYGPGGRGDAAADVAARSRTTGLPIGFVALGGGVVGTATLDAQSFGATDAATGPWLIGLAVAVDARQSGIGSALVAAAEAHATQSGAKAIYATTRRAQGLLLRRNWVAQYVVTDDAGLDWQVLSKAL
ncbi:GNAT family N-acetyltransferase [Yoonia sp. R2331]|uniref:GNAT family N-acetyltransferase n=1 Tax=Yoonia sp. R2331 TaxID=3237238 RepID=UPI0034E382B6